MNSEEYYIAPSDEIFEDVKQAAIELWQTYDNTFGYVTEKLSRIQHIQNVRDNTAYIVSMFDWNNKNKLRMMVKREDTKAWLKKLYDFSLGY